MQNSFYVTKISKVDVSKLKLINEPPPKTKKVKKVKGGKPIIHQIFYDCSEVISDEYWKKKLIQASKGKFPAKFSYSDGMLIFTKNSKHVATELPDDLSQMACVVCQFFRTYGHISSPNDEFQVRQITITKDELNWKKAKKRCKENLIAFYIQDITSDYNLSQKEKKSCFNKILSYLINKQISPSGIFIENNRIKEIENLYFDSEERNFFVKSFSKVSENKNIKRIEIHGASPNDIFPRFAHLWKDRCEKLTKKLNKGDEEAVHINYTTFSETISGTMTALTDEQI